MSTSSRRALCAASVLTLSLTVAPTPARASVDPFTTAPPNAADLVPGAIVRSRSLTLRSTLGQPLQYPAYQLAYRTTDAEGHPTVTAATVILPVRRTAGPRRLVAYQMAYDGLAASCRPSVRLRSGRAPEGSIIKALGRGWIVVTTDYEGPQDAWIAGRMAGQSVLDGVRATERFAPAGLDGTNTAVGLMGYSGGGQATAWANELAETYAPELRIVGSAQGGVPANPMLLAGSLDGGPFAGVMLGAIAGLSTAYPDAGVLDQLTTRGRAAIARVRAAGCITDFALLAPGTRLSSLTLRPDFLQLPQIQQILQDNTLGAAPPSTPTFMYHATNDHLVGYPGARALAQRYCSAGVPLLWRTGTGDHIGLPMVIGDQPLAYLQQRFDGAAPPSNCAALG